MYDPSHTVKKEGTLLKKFIRLIAIILALILVVVLGYLAYALSGYRRIADNTIPEIKSDSSGELPVGQTLTALTWNIGYGANDAQSSFFLDGGTQSRARSKEAVLENIGAVQDVLVREAPSVVLLQEVDTGSDRSYFVNEVAGIESAFSSFDAVYAVNVHTRFLVYPMPEPIGRMNGGLLTLVNAKVSDSVRRSLPIESGIGQLIDLDRCYTVSTVLVEGGRSLKLINVHLSAYSDDPAIRDSQLEKLYKDMEQLYAEGCYVIVGGDFNCCMAGPGSTEYTWTQPLDTSALPEGFTSVSSEREEHSCRNLDTPYLPGTTYTITIDGFLVSDNVTVEDVSVLPEDFAHSDHNPVRMRFTLN